MTRSTHRGHVLAGCTSVLGGEFPPTTSNANVISPTEMLEPMTGQVAQAGL